MRQGWGLPPFPQLKAMAPGQDFLASALVTFGARCSLLQATVLCIVGGFRAFLASTYTSSTPPSLVLTTRSLPMFPDIPCRSGFPHSPKLKNRFDPLRTFRHKRNGTCLACSEQDSFPLAWWLPQESVLVLAATHSLAKQHTFLFIVLEVGEFKIKVLPLWCTVRASSWLADGSSSPGLHMEERARGKASSSYNWAHQEDSRGFTRFIPLSSCFAGGGEETSRATLPRVRCAFPF